MNYKNILKHKPWLKPVHVHNLCNRLQELTKGNVFIVYNTIQQNYELHTIESYNLSGDSYNTSLSLECVNGFIYHDYRANDYKLFKDEVQSDRIRKDIAYTKRENTRYNLDDLLKTIERTIGTKI